VGLDDKIRLLHLKKLVDHHVGQTLEELEHGIAFVVCRVELVIINGQPGFRGHRDDAVVDEGNLGLGHGFGAEDVPNLHPVLELHRGGGELASLQDIHPAFHLGNVAHHCRRRPRRQRQTQGQHQD